MRDKSPDTQKHTPGPWQVCGDGFTVKGQPLGKPYTTTIADCVGYKYEREANARLIASAPSLLEALKLAEATLERLAPAGSRATQGTRDVISAAIAKAEGRHV